MKTKRYRVIGIALVFCLMSFGTSSLGQEEKEQTETIKLLEKRIKQLEQTVKRKDKSIFRLKKELAEQIEDNKRLKALCKEVGVNTTRIADVSFRLGEIVYRGKKCSQKWFDRMYERFCDKIGFVDGKYVDISKDILNLRGIWTCSPTSKKCRMGVAPYPSKVLTVLGNGEVLIYCTHNTHVNILHIRGVEHNFVDNEPWPKGTPLIRTGTFNYTAANGEHKTVWSFTVYKPLTKEQFADAIKSGFELIN